eukprot:7170551-Pyramimonas_sp.AAC.1
MAYAGSRVPFSRSATSLAPPRLMTRSLRRCYTLAAGTPGRRGGFRSRGRIPPERIEAKAG